MTQPAGMNIEQAISFLQAHGFLVKGYGYPEADSGTSGYADNYRVIQGDFDTGMIEPHQLVDVACHIRQDH